MTGKGERKEMTKQFLVEIKESALKELVDFMSTEMDKGEKLDSEESIRQCFFQQGDGGDLDVRDNVKVRPV